MLGYLDTHNTLHTRLVDFTIEEYLFVMQVVMGEDPTVAYAMMFDEAEFKRNVPSEDEEEYLARMKRNAEAMLEQQSCKHLREYLESEYQREVQDKATTLQDYKFTGSDVQKLLNNLLHDRTQELSESSVRDILALIKSMYESGALDSSDAFERHFVTVAKKYDIICPQCNREAYAVEGLDFRCQHCGLVAKWSEEERRYYPKLTKL